MDHSLDNGPIHYLFHSYHVFHFHYRGRCNQRYLVDIWGSRKYCARRVGAGLSNGNFSWGLRWRGSLTGDGEICNASCSNVVLYRRRMSGGGICNAVCCVLFSHIRRRLVVVLRQESLLRCIQGEMAGGGRSDYVSRYITIVIRQKTDSGEIDDMGRAVVSSVDRITGGAVSATIVVSSLSSRVGRPEAAASSCYHCLQVSEDG